MSQTQEKNSARPATARAEELMDRMGRGFGAFVASTGQRIQSTTTNLREKADQRTQSETTREEKPSQPAPKQAGESNPQTMEKADELVGQVEQRIGRFTSWISLHVQKAIARTREEAEDMWAEAENIHHQNPRKPR